MQNEKYTEATHDFVEAIKNNDIGRYEKASFKADGAVKEVSYTIGYIDAINLISGGNLYDDK